MSSKIGSVRRALPNIPREHLQNKGKAKKIRFKPGIECGTKTRSMRKLDKNPPDQVTRKVEKVLKQSSKQKALNTFSGKQKEKSLYKQGSDLFKNMKYPEAMLTFKKLFKLDIDDNIKEKCLQIMSKILFSQKKFVDVIPVYEQILALTLDNDTKVKALHNKAISLGLINRKAEAVAVYEQAYSSATDEDLKKVILKNQQVILTKLLEENSSRQSQLTK